MNAHRVKILDAADDHDRVVVVAHHLEFVLLPAQHRLLDEDGVDRTVVQALPHDAAELRLVVRDAPAASPERVGGADDGGVADLAGERERLVEGRDHAAGGRIDADARHRLLEGAAVLALVDRVVVRADQLHAVAFQDAGLPQGLGEVERGLPPEGREQRVGAFRSEDRLDVGGIQRFDVGPVGDVGVGHDRRGVAVHEHDAVAGRPERLARLRAGVVELRRLTDLDRSAPDEEDGASLAGAAGVPCHGCCRKEAGTS